ATARRSPTTRSCALSSTTAPRRACTGAPGAWSDRGVARSGARDQHERSEGREHEQHAEHHDRGSRHAVGPPAPESESEHRGAERHERRRQPSDEPVGARRLHQLQEPEARGGRRQPGAHPGRERALVGEPGAVVRRLRTVLGQGEAALGVGPRAHPSERNSWTLGRSFSDAGPKRARKVSVVPYWSGRPGTSARPTTLTSLWSSRLFSIGPTFTPRIASISARITGWR